MRVSLPDFSKQQTANPEPEQSRFRASREQQTAGRLGRFSIFDHKGFTLIELLVVSAIVVILLVIALARYATFGHQVDLDTAAQRILSSLQLARNQTVASENESVYGVHFETPKYVLFKGATYDPTSTDNKEYSLDQTEIYEINLAGGGSEVVFDRVRGSTANSGDIKIRLLADPTRSKTILINPLGQVSLEETVTPTGARVADTRHLHFDLGWSIQTATTLRFVFSDPPNPNVTKDIAMVGYFNAGKTEFDWGGMIDVNGANQVLRVHTHFLDASNTILSVHRDRRYNNKAVQILIDGKEIVSYTAPGAATVGAFGGVMTQQ